MQFATPGWLWRIPILFRRAHRARFIAELPTNKPVLLMVLLHDRGGGTERHVRDLARFIRHEVNSLLLTRKQNGSMVLSGLEPTQKIMLEFDPANELHKLVACLRDCRVERLHIHHVLDSEPIVRQLVAGLQRPFDFTIHDYYILSPLLHLTGSDGCFLGDDFVETQDELPLHPGMGNSAPDLHGWQEQHAWLLKDAERILAPSMDTARRFRMRFPNLSLSVTPHVDQTTLNSTVMPQCLGPKEQLRIALLGTLAPHKGYQVVLETARLVRASKLPLTFTLIGDSIIPALDVALEEAGVSVIGRYRERDLSTLIDQSEVHVLWYPMQSPETYSYTLTAGLRSNCCLVVPDIGAFPERIVGRTWTWVQRWNSDASAWVSLFLSIRETLLTPPATPEEVALDFYRTEYLSWVSGRTKRSATTRPTRDAVSVDAIAP